MTRNVCIVQARMQSTRLPGKLFKDLAGQSVLEHVLRRCQAIDGIDAVCCAVSDDRASDPVALEAERVGAIVFRGSQDDVLERYHQAAVACQADTVMRITSDCPLVDPVVCAEVLTLLQEGGTDYCANNLPASWPHGLDCEVFSFAWLDRAAREAERPSDREHVTQFIRRHPKARKQNLPCPLPGISHHRWTLDNEDDFRFLAEVFARLPGTTQAWNYQTVLGVVEREPGLVAINADQDRYEGLKKSLSEDAEDGFAADKSVPIIGGISKRSPTE